MTEMELWNKYKQLKGTCTHIKLKNGNVIKGYPVVFTQAIDNEPEIAEIDIELENGQLTGAFQDEIESIEIVEG